MVYGAKDNMAPMLKTLIFLHEGLCPLGRLSEFPEGRSSGVWAVHSFENKDDFSRKMSDLTPPRPPFSSFREPFRDANSKRHSILY